MAVSLALASNTQTSCLSSIFVSALLTSPQLPELLAKNYQRLSEAYVTLTTLLRRHGLRYIPSYAGLYLYAQISPATSWDEESRVIQKLKDRGVLVSAGRGYHGPESERGWARIGFAIPKEQLNEAVKIMDLVFEEEANLRSARVLKETPKLEIDITLNHLINSLERTLGTLKSDAHDQLVLALHDYEKLPDKNIYHLANKAINLLHETEQLLEPGPLVLADQFLGMVSTNEAEYQ